MKIDGTNLSMIRVGRVIGFINYNANDFGKIKMPIMNV